MFLSTCAIGEEAGELQSNVDAIRSMRKMGRLALGGDMDALASNDNVRPVGGHFPRELSVDAIMLEEPGVRLGIGEIVDRHQFQAAVRSLQDRTGDQAADAAEAVDCNFRNL